MLSPPLCGRHIHSRHTIVQPYWPGGVNVHAHLMHCSLGLSHSHSSAYTAARLVRPFLHNRWHILPVSAYLTLHRHIPHKICHGGIWTFMAPSNTWLLGPTQPILSQMASRSSQPFSLSKIHRRYNGPTWLAYTVVQKIWHNFCMP